MINDFEWIVETPVPLLHEGAKFIINGNSGGCNRDNRFKPNEHIIFVIDSFGIGCMDGNIGKDIINFEVLSNTQEYPDKYVVGFFGEINLERANELIEENYWIPYEEI
jgi:hypothetical protein